MIYNHQLTSKVLMTDLTYEHHDTIMNFDMIGNTKENNNQGIHRNNKYNITFVVVIFKSPLLFL